MKMKQVLTTFLLVFMCTFSLLNSEEIPKPTYENSTMFAWTHFFMTDDVSEIQYIKGQFGGGLYAPLMFSNFYKVAMAWNINPAGSETGISAFKTRIDGLVTFAKTHNVGMHLIINFGIARNTTLYNDAKAEDVRNAQWYSDNNISTQVQETLSRSAAWEANDIHQLLDLNHVPEAPMADAVQADSSILNKYVFTTFSRYARKLRAHLEAKTASCFAYLKKVQDANPGIFFVVSAPGESEMNYRRIQGSQTMQDYFCDYSPFAILEFRDWITHEGLYATGAKYAGEGYSGGGSKYQGAAGLAQFNSDFGTSFTSWNLKYFNWGLTDAVDTDYTDNSNPDTNIIPVSQYSYGNMMPNSGSNYTGGGFDAPRVMLSAGSSTFYDLWETFRHYLVYNYVKDMTALARASGFPKKQYYTHQIPADYLFGTRPNDPAIPDLNPRYHSSASPLWTADVFSDVGVGITLYDIKYPTWFARTSKYAISATAALNDNWAALEYHPETIPEGIGSTISSVSTIYDQLILLYNGSPHVISFFKWEDSSNPNVNTSVYTYKGNNRETAVKQFFNAIKDKARKSLSTVFTPKAVDGFTGSYNAGSVTLNWSSKIWSSLSHKWSNWGDFKEFAIYRGYSPDFAANSSSKIASTGSNNYKDYDFAYNTTVYYKLAALNSKGEAGPTGTVSVTTPDGVPVPILSVSLDKLNFGYIISGNAPASQTYRISNTGTGVLNWTAIADAAWVTSNPASGVNGAVVTVLVDPTGLAAGEYTATITVADPQATDSPKTISVYLNIKNASAAEKPFGSFDTPADNSTAMSSIPVTGWALDDSGLESVKLYRDPVSGEGSNLVYIGDAIFVEGARGDIALAYPTYPDNQRAGWGYMMLTNFLPGGGNGTFKLHAIAKDNSGNETTLGSKTVTIDNNSAVNPFGAIDTPSQGGTASTSSFINWGWVLTPQPAMMPIDGSTIKVIVDGVNIGNPNYNIYREDIATLFPGYANSGGAIGYFFLDTTTYRDGLHTIQWTATDNNGHTDGIGSRYFTIQNSGGDQARTTSAKHNMNLSMLKRLTRIPNKIPITVTRGFAKPTRLNPSNSGSINVTIRQDEPLVIAPQTIKGDRWSAFLKVGHQLRPLPVGTTFEPETGKLSWLPGYGFYGSYTFSVFAKNNNGQQVRKSEINVTILPKYGK